MLSRSEYWLEMVEEMRDSRNSGGVLHVARALRAYHSIIEYSSSASLSLHPALHNRVNGLTLIIVISSIDRCLFV